MKLNRIRKTLAVILVAVFCLTSVLSVTAFAAGTSSGTAPSGTAPGGTAPSGTAPSGTAPGGTAPGGTAPGGTAPGAGGGADTATYDYSGTLSGALTADGTEQSSDGKTTAATHADQNAALAENGGSLKIVNGTLTKSGDDTNGDNCNFYGINSILLAVGDGSTAYLSGSGLSADSQGSNGIFATDNAVVYANDDTISTTADNSRGLDATYGGTILANQMDIATLGDHCAAIATDRGGGTISATNSKLSTAGSGSPLLYSTGDLEVDNVTGKATGSQIAGMEGLNTILIHNSTLSSDITGATASDPVANGIIIYQSTSGDAEGTTGDTAVFEASDSKLSSAITSGSMFYCTNTTANVVLSNTTLDFDFDAAKLLTVQGNDANNWGTAGSNGATVRFTGLGETLSGDIDVDTISTLDLYLLQDTVYTGAIAISTNAVNTAVSKAPVTVNLDGTSTWIVTGNSTVTNLNLADGAAVVDESGKTVTIQVAGKTVVSGDSAYTVTVTGSYSNTVTTDADNALSTSYTDRTGFDAYYGVSTAFGTNGTQSDTADADSSSGATSTATAGKSGHGALIIVIAVAAILAGDAAWRAGRRKKKQDSTKP
jgi:hypothetical protein